MAQPPAVGLNVSGKFLGTVYHLWHKGCMFHQYCRKERISLVKKIQVHPEKEKVLILSLNEFRYFSGKRQGTLKFPILIFCSSVYPFNDMISFVILGQTK